MSLKNKIIPVALGLTLLVPTVVFASDNITTEGTTRNFGSLRSFRTERVSFDENWQPKNIEISEEVREKFIEIKDKLQKDEITPEEFREEMKEFMPERSEFEFKGRKGLNHNKINLPEETKEKIHELRTKFHNGEITKEQFMQEVQELTPEKIQNRDSEQFKMKRKFSEEAREEARTKIGEFRENRENVELDRGQFRQRVGLLRTEKL